MKNKKNDEFSREANIIFAKNGNGYTTTRITLPVPFIKKLGFTEKDRTALISIEDNKIIITKKK